MEKHPTKSNDRHPWQENGCNSYHISWYKEQRIRGWFFRILWVHFLLNTRTKEKRKCRSSLCTDVAWSPRYTPVLWVVCYFLWKKHISTSGIHRSPSPGAAGRVCDRYTRTYIFQRWERSHCICSDVALTSETYCYTTDKTRLDGSTSTLLFKWETSNTCKSRDRGIMNRGVLSPPPQQMAAFPLYQPPIPLRPTWLLWSKSQVHHFICKYFSRDLDKPPQPLSQHNKYIGK